MSLSTTKKAKTVESAKFTHTGLAIPQAMASVTSHTVTGQRLGSVTRIRLLIRKVQTPSICSPVHEAKPEGRINGILRGPTPLPYCSKGGSSHLTLPAQIFWRTECCLKGKGCKGIILVWWDVEGGAGYGRSRPMAWSPLPPSPSTALQEREFSSQQHGVIEEIGMAPVQP